MDGRASGDGYAAALRRLDGAAAAGQGDGGIRITLYCDFTATLDGHAAVTAYGAAVPRPHGDFRAVPGFDGGAARDFNCAVPFGLHFAASGWGDGGGWVIADLDGAALRDSDPAVAAYGAAVPRPNGDFRAIVPGLDGGASGNVHGAARFGLDGAAALRDGDGGAGAGAYLGGAAAWDSNASIAADGAAIPWPHGDLRPAIPWFDGGAARDGHAAARAYLNFTCWGNGGSRAAGSDGDFLPIVGDGGFRGCANFHALAGFYGGGAVRFDGSDIDRLTG